MDWIVAIGRNACKAPRIMAIHRQSVPTVLLLLLLAVTGTASAAPATNAGTGDLPTIVGLVSAGQFREAAARIDAALQQAGLSAQTREALDFQRARMQRMREDFSLSAAEVAARVRKQIPDLTAADFERWDAQGLFEHMDIDGARLYFARSPANLFHLSAAARARSSVPIQFADSGLPKDFTEQITDYDQDVIRHARTTIRSSVLPQRVRVTQTVTVDADAVPAGKTIRAWIPYPRYIPGQQEDIHLVASQPGGHRLAPRSALQRTVYLE
jgi:hypothetical protein